MFQVLTESGPQAAFGAQRYFLSLGLHGVLIAGAVALTRPSSIPATPARAESAVIYVPPARPREARSATLPRAPEANAPAPPVWDLRIAPPDLGAPPLQGRLPAIADLLKSMDSHHTTGADPRSLSGVSGPTGPDPLPVESVDDPVIILKQPAPDFPPVLAQAGVGGRVVLAYVVDTAGRAEPGSLRTLTSTHPAFEASARASVLASRYRPARLRGRLVRQMVHQTLSFRLAESR
jgi:outer membrane biosynthesis protein TonB